jgi:tight adherence protein B
MRRLRLMAASLVALVAIAPASVAQAQAPASLSITAVDLSAFPAVTATVGVPPALAGRVLPPEAFTVAEGGRAVATKVTPLPGEQLEVIVVVDTSGSMAGASLEAAKRAAVSFLSAMPAAARIAVVGFGAVPVLASGFSLDRQALAGAVNGLVARGETALYDAVVMAVAQFPEASGASRSIVLLSDGGDTASGATLERAAAAVAGAKVHFDAVALASVEANDAALASLAAAGAGRVAPVSEPAALDAVYADIAARLANQYQITFTSAGSGPTELRVALSDEGVTAEGAATLDLPLAPPAAAPPTAAPPATAAPPSPPPARSWPSGAVLLVVGAVAFFVAVYLVALVALLPRTRRSARLARLGRDVSASTAAAPSAISGLADRATNAADAALERRGKRGLLNAALERAGVALRPGEFVVLGGCVSLVAFLAGLLYSGLLLGLLGAAVVASGARVVLGMLARRRQARFAGQLTDTLQLLVGSMRAGYGLLQAFDAVGREAESPTAEEFRRLVVESRLGRALPDSLDAMAERVASQDFRWVVEAIEINREIGGDLAEVLDTITGTIRERDFIKRQVKSLSAEGRLSAYVLLALPVFLSLMIRWQNPDYFAELTRGTGLFLSAFAVVCMLMGAAWLRKICRLVF